MVKPNTGGTAAKRLADSSSVFIIGSFKVERWRSKGRPHDAQYRSFTGLLQWQINFVRGWLHRHRMSIGADRLFTGFSHALGTDLELIDHPGLTGQVQQ